MEIATTAPRVGSLLPQALKTLSGLLLLLASLGAGYHSTLTPVTLVIDDSSRPVRTHQDTVAALVADMGVDLHPEDTIFPPVETSIQPGLTVQIDRARQVEVSVDGQSLNLLTRATSLNEILSEAKVTLGPHDQLTVEGNLHATGCSDLIPRVIIERAVPIVVREDDRATTYYTTASTVGEALHQAGFVLYLADRVLPGLSTRVAENMQVDLERSTPVKVQVDGRSMRTRTHRERVGDVLADLGIVLTGEDYTKPPADAATSQETSIDVFRVSERFLIEQEPIPYESVWRPDPNLEIDNQTLLQEGAPGVLERRIRVRYENGHEVSRTLENEYVAVPATTNVRGYGTKVVLRTIDTYSGPVEYWRKIRMLATSYSAATAGTPETSAWYGRTATGAKMRKGIVAVDPRLINLGSKVFVPGYGVGLAADTGGAVRGKRIDLGYDNDNLELWYRWVDVYLLAPVPPASQIDYTLP